MNLTAWLDVAIGLAIVYLGASLFVTIIGEYVSHVLNLRGKTLWDSLRKLISDEELRTRLAKNPALTHFFAALQSDGKTEGAAAKAARKALAARRRASPTYVDPIVVARALLAVPANGGAQNGKAELPPKLQEVVGAVGEKTEEMVQAVSHWVDASLTMLGEKYKRNQQAISLGVGAIVAVSLNLDTVALTTRLYRDKEARDAVVAVALDVTSRIDKPTFDRCIALEPDKLRQDTGCVAVSGLVDSVRLRNGSLGKLPIGWGEEAERATGITAAAAVAAAQPSRGSTQTVAGSEGTTVPIEKAQVSGGATSPPAPEATPGNAPPAWYERVGGAVKVHLVGWVLTSLALALGAPFWFDLLAKFVNIRHGMKRPDVKGAEGKGDAG